MSSLLARFGDPREAQKGFPGIRSDLSGDIGAPGPSRVPRTGAGGPHPTWDRPQRWSAELEVVWGAFASSSALVVSPPTGLDCTENMSLEPRSFPVSSTREEHTEFMPSYCISEGLGLAKSARGH